MSDELTFSSEGSDENMDLIKFERMGYSVGQRLIERFHFPLNKYLLIERATKEKPRFGETLEIIKFICKEFWVDVFKKQVDNLRTNHRVSIHNQHHRFIVQLSDKSGSICSPR